MKPVTQKENGADTAKLPKIGSIVEGPVIGTGRSAIYIDLGTTRPAVIYGREFLQAKSMLKNLQKGAVLRGKVISLENEDGYIELSVRDAQEFFNWDQLQELKDKKETIKVKILSANKGGLLTEVMNIPAFIPVSQLSSKNYPKVDDRDADKILRKLQEFVGQELEVKVLDISKKDDKLILSEKATTQEISEILKKYKIGDVVDGEITEVTNFGAFIKFPAAEQEYEGLIHISEMDWKLVKNPSDVVKQGEIVQAQIISVNDDGKIFLSLKSLKKKPAKETAETPQEAEK
ncbi:MAG TPA: S1 RNA-binding domain-containing protein [Candidatus Pacearchaeota archaeon]|nr:S1 RNA-binding domain-containing protein [Candidatus Pacearchaeota archaeon]